MSGKVLLHQVGAKVTLKMLRHSNPCYFATAVVFCYLLPFPALFPYENNQESPRQTKSKKGQFDVNRACFPKEKTPEFTKMGEIHELFVLALSLVWFAGTPEASILENSR